MPTRPVDHGCSAAHAITWEMSSASWSESRSPRPSECPPPRVSRLITAYPCWAHQTGSGASQLVWSEIRSGSGWFMIRNCGFSDQRPRFIVGTWSLP